MLDYLFPILSFIDLFSDWKPTISFILTSLIVIIVLPLYLKWPRKKGKLKTLQLFISLDRFIDINFDSFVFVY
ncbi:hypothetical protein LEP1GSC109_4409 [Leptospira interrogans str. UI 13372]|nr:hypothetical protein LEP1GSC109_4409 [Leptospira interrogans str. UI 13372]